MATIEKPVEFAELVAGYLRVWSEDDAAERVAILERVVADDVEFIDPMKRCVGRAALADHVASVRAMFPGMTSGVRGEVGRVREFMHAAWFVQTRDGTLNGRDFYDLDDDGRIRRIVGFFEETVPNA